MALENETNEQPSSPAEESQSTQQESSSLFDAFKAKLDDSILDSIDSKIESVRTVSHGTPVSQEEGAATTAQPERESAPPATAKERVPQEVPSAPQDVPVTPPPAPSQGGELDNARNTFLNNLTNEGMPNQQTVDAPKKKGFFAALKDLFTPTKTTRVSLQAAQQKFRPKANTTFPDDEAPSAQPPRAAPTTQSTEKPGDEMPPVEKDTPALAGTREETSEGEERPTFIYPSTGKKDVAIRTDNVIPEKSDTPSRIGEDTAAKTSDASEEGENEKKKPPESESLTKENDSANRDETKDRTTTPSASVTRMSDESEVPPSTQQGVAPPTQTDEDAGLEKKNSNQMTSE